VHVRIVVTLDQLLKQENIVLEFWTTRKRRIDQCQQYVVLETSAKQVIIPSYCCSCCYEQHALMPIKTCVSHWIRLARNALMVQKKALGMSE